ncbi:hyalin-like isoform X1 [Acanthaster planci]|uniref:Hyalin-like isoform X1 n=1 Tax=Acanthaster planci TaxID=133434 RepID=A0A8B7Z3Z2_ACAPL|nr:hyalin-like isoform X1 [Acanthaster planci]
MPRVLSSKSTLLGVLTGVTLLVSFKLADASTFALIADLENGTIYRGYLSQNLADLTPLPLNGVMRPVAVDYDPVEGMVYWTDQRSESAPKICRAHLDGSNQTTVVGDLTDPGGMALDVASRMLYWTDGALAHIGRARMDGTGSKEILLSENHYNPKGIVVDSVHGHIFWSDWGENPRIERADLDGNNRRIVVQGGLSYPSSVTIDFNGNSLYWIDAIHDTIETSDLSGSNRRLVANLTVYSLSFPFDLAVYGDYVYWTEWGMYPTILRVHLDGRGAETIGPSIFQMPGGIHIQEEEEVDSTPPVVTGCPNEGVFKAVPLGYTSANVTWTPPTASDDSGMASVTMSSNRVPGQSFNLGRTHVQYNFTDAAGNQAFCDFVVTVSAVDSTNPTISCPPTIVRYVRSATQQLPVSWQFPTASDDSGNQPTITSTPNYPTSSGTFGAGMHSVTYLARDGAGNQASCILTINIILDSRIPTITGCPGRTIAVLPPGSSSVAVSWTEPVGADDNGVVNMTRSHRPGNTFTLGNATVTYTFTDQAGNQATCRFTVSVSRGDVTSPVISCPPTIVRYVRTATQQLSVSWPSPTASDDSGIQPTITSTPNYPTPSGTFGAGMHSVVYSARDEAGNQASCTLWINIILDSRIPTITGCPGRTIAVLPPGSSSVAVSWTEPVGADDNGVVNMTRSHRPGITFTLGNATVTYTFTDQAGNQATCTFTVSVSRGDVTNPVISCPPTIVRYVRTATQQLSVSWPSPTASDDSGIQPTITSTPNYPTPSGTFGAGMHSVVYSARDEAGNQASCTLWINIILDSQAPTMAGCPGTTVVSTGNRSVDVSWTEPVSIDANGVVNMTRSHRPGDRFAVGDTFVRYTFTDRAGNQATCTFTVRVVAGCLLTPDQFDHLEVVSGQQSVYLPGESVQLTCQDGYQLSGSASRFCRSDLTWSGEPAVCVQQGEPMGGTVVGFGAGASGVLLLILLLLVVIFLIRRRKKTRVRAPDLAITAQITTQGDLGIYDNPQPVYETVVRGAAAPPPKEEETALSEVKPPLPSTPTPGYPPPSYEYAHADRHNYNLPPTYIPME